MTGLGYWDRLKRLGLFSVERRRERYIVIYVYKILCDDVPNLTDSRFALKFYENIRLGRFCRIPPINSGASARVKTMIDNSFAVRAPRLFNCLPRDLRNFEGTIDSFQKNLDIFLADIPDRPCLANYHQAAAGNSIVQQLAQLRNEGLYM